MTGPSGRGGGLVLVTGRWSRDGGLVDSGPDGFEPVYTKQEYKGWRSMLLSNQGPLGESAT